MNPKTINATSLPKQAETASPVTLARIQEARERIHQAIAVSPCSHSHALSRLAGSPVFLKLENLQRTGAFKERGALNKLLCLTVDERKRGLVTASAGNHAQAVAYHASRLGIRAEIWMPLTTPLVKVSSTQSHGVKVVLHGTGFDETYEASLERCRERQATFIHPFDDEDVIAGQGTIALELLEQIRDIEVVVTSVGGGGLISGIAVALKELKPAIRVIGVQSSLIPSMVRAAREGHPVTLPAVSTVADGIAVRSAGEKTLPLVKKYVDDLVVVDDEEIAAAILFLLEREKTMAEGAGACGVAALLHGKISLGGKTAAIVISGGNLDVTLLSRIIERGLVKDGRLVRLRIPLPDHPGALHRLTQVIAGQRINIVETEYHRTFYGARLGHTLIDLTMEARDLNHANELSAALTAAGYNFERIT
ncbi:MAG: threonine ammonia-lyase [Terriglobales bacterium]